MRIATDCRAIWILPLVGIVSLLQLAGCPTQTDNPLEYVSGGTGDTGTVGSTPTVDVLSPVSDLAISGGTPVEVNWRATVRTRTAVISVLYDRDLDPENGNEIIAQTDLTVADNSAILNTTRLAAGDYFIVVTIEEAGVLVASDYAPGRLTINQAPTFFFTSPRDNPSFDRTSDNNPRFDVAWQVNDPDSIVTVQIFLDPDNSPNGNEILLRESNSQTGDSFSFDLPTASFAAGTYRLLALVSDGVDTLPFYAPGAIRLRSRLAGNLDLRDLPLPNAPVRGAVFEGFNPRDNAGSFVTGVTDIDRDGFGDFMILSQFAKPQYIFNTSRTGIGEAYMIYGRQDRFTGSINLNSTGQLFRGEVYGGVPEVTDPLRPSRGITSFTVLSDWDGDGFREFAFGQPFVDSLAVSDFTPGSSNRGLAPLDVNGYFRSGGVIITASSSLRPDLGFPGNNVFILGEFGTLKYDPGTPTPAPCPEGFYGPKAPPSAADVTLFHRHLAPGIGGIPNTGSVRGGCRFSSNEPFDQYGETISAYQFDSLLISAPSRDPLIASLRAPASVPGSGTIELYYCETDTGFFPWESVNFPPANAALGYVGTPPSTGTNAIPHNGPFHYIMNDYRLFATAAGALEGSPGFWVDPDDALSPCLTIQDPRISSPDSTFIMWSNVSGARLSNVKALGDFNADGWQDFTIGAPFVEDGAGSTYIILGRNRNLVRGGDLELEELNLPVNDPVPGNRRIFDGIRILGNVGERLGNAQDSAGDFNGDGIADVVVGSPLLNDRAGGAVVIFGSKDILNLTEREIPFSELATRGLGVTFVGENPGDLAGARVAGCGDIDRDGNADILIAAPDRSVRLDLDQDGTFEIDRTDCGVVYLIYGSPNLRGTLPLSAVGTSQLPGAVFIGRASGDHLGAGLGEQGDRSNGIAGIGDIDGDGRGDLMLGSVTASPRGRVRAGEAYLIYGIGD